MKAYFKLRKKALTYFSHHVEYTAFVHVLGGIGLGIMIARPLADPHPIRWGIALITLSLLGHLYAVTRKK